MKKHKYLTIENSMENDDEEDEDSSSELYKIDINIGNNLTKTLVINAKNNLQELDDFFNQYEIPFEKRTNITNNIIKQIGEPFFKIETGRKSSLNNKTKPKEKPKQLIPQKSYDDIRTIKPKKKVNYYNHIPSRYQQEDVRENNLNELKKRINDEREEEFKTFKFSPKLNKNKLYKNISCRYLNKNFAPSTQRKLAQIKENLMKQEEFSFSPQLTKTKLYYKKHNKPQKNSKNEEHDKSVDSKNDEKHSNLSSDKICKEIDKRNDNLYQKRKIDKNDSNKKYNDQEIYTFRPKVLEYKGHRQLNNVFERLYPIKTEEKIFQPIVNTMEDFDKLNNKPKKKIKIPVTYKDRRKPKENKEIVNEKTTNTKQREQLEDIFLKNLGNQIFSQLDSDNDGKISIQKINISSIPNEALLNFEPIFEYLQTTQKEIDKKKFHKLLKKIGHENLDFFQNQ